MKKIILFFCGIVVAVALMACLSAHCSTSEIMKDNLEALADGEGAKVYSCLGLWGSCTLADGATSKAPLVEIQL